MLLTMQGGLLFPVSWLFGKIMEIIYNILAVDGVANIGICIIIFTVIVKLIMLPMNIKMQKSTKINSYIQPEIQKIQKKYKNKTDQDSILKQNQEVNAVYSKYGTSMTSGCMTSLIQFPIIFGLYDVVRNIPAYVSSIKVLYTPIADSMINAGIDYQTVLTKFVNDHNISTAAQYIKEFGKHNASDEIINVLGQFSTDNWQEFAKLVEGNPEVISAMNANLNQINEINEFMFGINMADAPGFVLAPALLIPIASTVFQLISMLVSMRQSKKNSAGGEGSEMANSMMKSMMFMPIMSFFMCVVMPCGIGLYWAFNSFISLILQIGTNFYFDRIANMEKIIEKQMQKAAKKNAKKQGKKSFMERMLEAQGETSQDAPISRQVSNANLRNYDVNKLQGNNKIQSVDNAGKKYKQGSMASKANIMLNFEDVKGKEK